MKGNHDAFRHGRLPGQGSRQATRTTAGLRGRGGIMLDPRLALGQNRTQHLAILLGRFKYGRVLRAFGLHFAALFAAAVVFYFQAKRDAAQVRSNATAALERYSAISDLEKYKAELDVKLNQARAWLPKFQALADMERHKQQLASHIADLERADADWQQRISSHESTLAQLVAQMQSVEETLEMQSFGFYRPKYEFQDSKRYELELDKIRGEQKALLNSESATHCSVPVMVDGSAAKGRQMVKEHSKLMLRAFNGECDAAIAKVKCD
jgi:hypothetical protein